MTATIIAMMIRGLYWHKAERSHRVDGRVKASWIAECFKISLRAVRSARKRLLELGWIESIHASQWELNHWGQRYAISVEFNWKDLRDNGIKSAPQKPANDDQFAPPDQKRLSSTKLVEDPKNRTPIPERSVFSLSRNSRGRRIGEEALCEPKLHDMVSHDLIQFDRLLVLYEQAVGKKLAEPGDGGRLEFFALADRAKAKGKDSVKLFSWLLHRQRFDLVSDANEDQANAWLKQEIYGVSGEPR